MKPVRWEDMAWPDIPAALERCGRAVLWPFGATEQHGPHLGTGVDTVIAERLCKAVSAETGVPVLPVQSVGCSLGHSRRWPGTLSLTPGTLIALVAEVGDWLYSAGVRRLFLINAHVTNAAPLRCSLELLRSRYDDLLVALINSPDISSGIRGQFFADGNDWHANAAETSLMMHLRPDGVVAGRVRDSDDPDRTAGLQFAHPVNHTSRNGVTGSPSMATLAAGEALFAQMVRELADRVRAGCSEEPPLAEAKKIL